MATGVFHLSGEIALTNKVTLCVSGGGRDILAFATARLLSTAHPRPTGGPLSSLTYPGYFWRETYMNPLV